MKEKVRCQAVNFVAKIFPIFGRNLSLSLIYGETGFYY